MDKILSESDLREIERFRDENPQRHMAEGDAEMLLASHRALAAMLDDVAEFLRERADVRDGPDGEQRPNAEMSLLNTISTAFVKSKTSAAEEGVR